CSPARFAGGRIIPAGALSSALTEATLGVVTPVVQRWIEDGRRDPERFWDRAAREVHWFKPWDRTFEWTGPAARDAARGADAFAPAFRWFVGGETNLAYNALDLHVERGRAGHAALVWLNERGERRLFTYASLRHEVERAAAALRAQGI